MCAFRPNGAAKLPLHADQNWLPAPFPVHNQLLTFCWACDEFTEAGVKMYEYGDGFLHQKVMLIDDHVATIGTANFDNRSFRLNFEISVLTFDEGFAGEVEAMLNQDFAKSTLIDSDTLSARSQLSKLASRVARVFAPVL